MPEVPTIAESGYPGYEALNWYAYLAPAATPPGHRRAAEPRDRQGARNPKARAARQAGVEPEPTTPAELGEYMKREYETWGKVVKQKGIKAE